VIIALLHAESNGVFIVDQELLNSKTELDVSKNGVLSKICCRLRDVEQDVVLFDLCEFFLLILIVKSGSDPRDGFFIDFNLEEAGIYPRVDRRPKTTT
jgi:hypothetical protein